MIDWIKNLFKSKKQKEAETVNKYSDMLNRAAGDRDFVKSFKCFFCDYECEDSADYISHYVQDHSLEFEEAKVFFKYYHKIKKGSTK